MLWKKQGAARATHKTGSSGSEEKTHEQTEEARAASTRFRRIESESCEDDFDRRGRNQTVAA
jgi:hypothetical protein